ncbi:hypothetical protein [Crocinitomix catalasitica]|uniref:hypothetical protein n=1 Tax=Crocinitomix catalasitica TaxID=184607 RepID=UPI0004836494|nr:hypothetical protein [Crocinitomix catalasitica]
MKKITYLILTISLGLFSCKKHEIIPGPIPTSNLENVFTDNVEDAKQDFTINNNAGGSFTGVDGTIVTVPVDAFVYADGSTVTGAVNIEMIEVLNYNDMVLMNKPTVSGDNILVSGGQLKITATKSGSQVYLAPDASLSVMVPTDAPDDRMALYEGIESLDGPVDWALIEDTVVVVEEDSLEGGVYYYFEFDNPDLGWINCDYRWDNPAPQTTISAVLDAEYRIRYTSCFVVFPEINSVINLYPNDTISSTYRLNNVPTGSRAIFVCVAEIDDVYYSYISDETAITMDHMETAVMSPSTLEDIEAAIADL